jgi:hypothetical protein
LEDNRFLAIVFFAFFCTVFGEHYGGHLLPPQPVHFKRQGNFLRSPFLYTLLF